MTGGFKLSNRTTVIVELALVHIENISIEIQIIPKYLNFCMSTPLRFFLCHYMNLCSVYIQRINLMRFDRKYVFGIICLIICFREL